MKPPAALLGAARVLLPLLGFACSSDAPKVTARAPLDELEAAVTPLTWAAALRAAGGGHYKGTSLQRVSDPKQPLDDTAMPDSVTTTTDLWADRHGNYRLVETNDRDGGREVILHGKVIGVSLRYQKMIRRPAQDPEASRYLEEGLGAPRAAWDVVRRFLAVTETAEGVYKLSKAPRAAPPSTEDLGPLETWRPTIDVQTLQGEARVDAKTGLLTAFRLSARFGLSRDGKPLNGEVTVDGRVDGVGQTPSVGPPIADELRPRQRTILEERALLGAPSAGAKPEARGTSEPQKRN